MKPETARGMARALEKCPPPKEREPRLKMLMAADALRNSADEMVQLREALHAAIARPKGVVPDAALRFYDPAHPALEIMAASGGNRAAHEAAARRIAEVPDTTAERLDELEAAGIDDHSRIELGETGQTGAREIAATALRELAWHLMEHGFPEEGPMRTIARTALEKLEATERAAEPGGGAPDVA